MWSVARSFADSKKVYLALATKAGIPRQYQWDPLWHRMSPEHCKSTRQLRGEEYVRASAAEQKEWLANILANPKRFRSSACMVILGDFMANAAERCAFGLAGYAIRNGCRVRAVHVADLVEHGPPQEIDGTVMPYDVIVVHKLHTDDGPDRRGAIRDLISRHYPDAFVILVLYGEDALDFYYTKIGVEPTAVLFYPYTGGQLGATIKGTIQEH